MRKSAEEASKTRSHIVNEASKFILAHGIEKSGVAEIMKSAGLTQGGFYRHFDSKDQLVAEASAATFERLEKRFVEAVKGQSQLKAIDTIVAIYLDQHVNNDGQHLCPIANLGTEFHRLDEQIKSVAFDGHQQFVNLLSENLKRLELKRPEAFASAIGSLLIGAVVCSRLAPNRDFEKVVLDDARAAVRRMLKG